MEMTNVTQIRKNIRSILLTVSETRKPVAILQRSKPVAYIIDADSYERLSGREDIERKTIGERRKESLERILQLHATISRRTGVQDDSTLEVRELREEPDA